MLYKFKDILNEWTFVEDVPLEDYIARWFIPIYGDDLEFLGHEKSDVPLDSITLTIGTRQDVEHE